MRATDNDKILDAIKQLPDEAIIPDPVAAKLLGTSVWTLRRNNPVPPIRTSVRRVGRQLGAIRALGNPAAA
jgi:hypothetical protein